jgi:hypothetical protein
VRKAVFPAAKLPQVASNFASSLETPTVFSTEIISRKLQQMPSPPFEATRAAHIPRVRPALVFHGLMIRSTRASPNQSGSTMTSCPSRLPLRLRRYAPNTMQHPLRHALRRSKAQVRRVPRPAAADPGPCPDINSWFAPPRC